VQGCCDAMIVFRGQLQPALARRRHSVSLLAAAHTRHAAAKASPKGQPPSQLGGVKHILAVASGKGGVGKSSISVNLAYVLAHRGARVGILDADIYGPSLPVLVPVVQKGIYAGKAGGIQPVMYGGVKLMSMGYARPDEHAALRGPMASGMVRQMLTQTEWGDLDYLLLDMPPGTGDIHLTIAQSAPVDAAVVISTPHALAIADVEKGIAMFNKVSIPTIAVVENMSSFSCHVCGTTHNIFDRAGRCQRVADSFGIPSVLSLPLDSDLSPGAVASRPEPLVLDPGRNQRPFAQSLVQLAEVTEQELARLRKGGVKRKVNAARGPSGEALLEMRQTIGEGNTVHRSLSARDVRMACRSAMMRDEVTGAKLFREEDIALDVHATKIEPAGFYAVHIDWSDGHRSLMPHTLLEELASPQA